MLIGQPGLVILGLLARAGGMGCWRGGRAVLHRPIPSHPIPSSRTARQISVCRPEGVYLPLLGCIKAALQRSVIKMLSSRAKYGSGFKSSPERARAAVCSSCLLHAKSIQHHTQPHRLHLPVPYLPSRVHVPAVAARPHERPPSPWSLLKNLFDGAPPCPRGPPSSSASTALLRAQAPPPPLGTTLHASTLSAVLCLLCVTRSRQYPTSHDVARHARTDTPGCITSKRPC